MKLKVLVALFFLSILIVISSGKSFAQEEMMEGAMAPSPSIVLDVSATPTPTVTTVDYTLPYPGLLPDNPLYMLKAARDRIVQFLISDSAKKAEFFLLASDKRLNTGYYLIIKDKDDMGVLYISKSTNYMDMAIASAKEAKERGKATLSNISTSIKKHVEVIKKLQPAVDKKNRSKLQYEVDRLNKLQTRIGKK